jgi:hypothetical protein
MSSTIFKERNAAMQLNAIESMGGPKELMRESKVKVDFMNVRDKNGHDICRLVATMHLDSLGPEAYAFATDAFSKNNQIELEQTRRNGGQMSHALFIKELSDNYRDNPELQKQARNFALHKFFDPMVEHKKALKKELTDPGFPGKSPFDSSDNKGVFSSFINKVLRNEKSSESEASLSL